MFALLVWLLVSEVFFSKVGLICLLINVSVNVMFACVGSKTPVCEIVVCIKSTSLIEICFLKVLYIILFFIGVTLPIPKVGLDPNNLLNSLTSPSSKVFASCFIVGFSRYSCLNI